MPRLNRAHFFANFFIYLFICSAVLSSISAYESNIYTQKSWPRETDDSENSTPEKSSEEDEPNDYWDEVTQTESKEECDRENETDEQHKAHEEKVKQNKSHGRDNQDCGEEMSTDKTCEEDKMTLCPDDESDRNSKMVFEGAYAPVFTPTGENNELNFTIIPAYIKHLHRSGVKGILVAGTAGEGPTMIMEERKRLLEVYVMEARKHGLKVIAQISGTNVPDAKELATHAQEVKADAIMALPQIYYKPKSIKQLVGNLELLSNCAPKLPIFYYHIPEMSGVYVNIRALFKYASAKIPMFIGIKGSFRDALQLTDLLRCKQKVFVSGNYISASALIGFDTRITTVSNMFMDQVNAIQDAVKSSDFKKAKMLQDRLDNIFREINALGKEIVPLMKATMGIITNLDMGPARSPEMRINMQQKAAIRRVLEKYNVEIKTH